MFELRHVTFATLSAVVVVACLVPDVELVEELPGRGGAGGTASQAGNSAGGEPPPADGGEPSGAGAGTSGAGGSGAGGSAGSDAGGTPGSDGGVPGSSGNGGSAGSGPTTWKFGDTAACDADSPLFCDDFEVQRISNWGAGPLWARKVISDAPSPTRVMDTAFKDAPMAFVKPAAGFNLSFWVRFPSLTDQHFVTWPLADGNLSFGLEESSFRFRLDSNPVTVAPELAKHTRGATVDTWTCVDIDWVPDGEFKATVIVFR